MNPVAAVIDFHGPWNPGCSEIKNLVEHILPIWVYELYRKGVYFKVFYWQYSINSIYSITMSNKFFRLHLSRFLGSYVSFTSQKTLQATSWKTTDLRRQSGPGCCGGCVSCRGWNLASRIILGPFLTVTHGIFSTTFTIWMFPKIVGFSPKSSILIGFSIIFTIHFGVSPYFWKHPYV